MAQYAFQPHPHKRLIVRHLIERNEDQMGSIDFQIAALQGGSATPPVESPFAQDAQPASQIPRASKVSAASVPSASQDTVSLSGTFPPPQRQQNAPPGPSTQPAAFTLLAHEFTFPPAQTVAAQTAVGSQSPVVTSTATAGANASAASALNVGPPQQTLQQLDQVLQRLGIDPQSLSLISREGMLNWVNDPAALRQIVHTLQSTANNSPLNAAASAASPAQTAAPLSATSANQTQVQSQTPNSSQASAQEAIADSSAPPASTVNTNVVNQSAATAQQNVIAAQQFQQLQISLAPSPAADAPSASSTNDSTPPQGQLLNVSA